MVLEARREAHVLAARHAHGHLRRGRIVRGRSGDCALTAAGTVQGGLESAQKLRTTWAALRDAGLTEELERTKKEVELKQKQLEGAGLAATESQHAELERLKQQAEILAKQKAIGDAALEPGDRQNALLKQQVDLLKSQKELSEATRTLQAEQELYNLRLEIERLEAEKKRRDSQ